LDNIIIAALPENAITILFLLSYSYNAVAFLYRCAKIYEEYFEKREEE